MKETLNNKEIEYYKNKHQELIKQEHQKTIEHNKKYKNLYKKINSLNLKEEQKELLKGKISLPVNHMTGYFKGDDIYNDMVPLTKEEKIIYGLC